MLFGGYEHWMLRFWTLRKLDATLLDALIATRHDTTHISIIPPPQSTVDMDVS